MESFSDWVAGGERVRLRLGGWPRAYSVFCRVEGQGEWLTLLHGFPTCSWDWAGIYPPLARGHRLLMFDFLGFGDSDKPADHAYSIHGQADLVEALWAELGVRETGLVVHDYGVSVGQELLARQLDGRLGAKVNKVAFMNGGLYAHLHRPLLVQKLLRKPVLGALLSRVTNEKLFSASLSKVFSSRHPLGTDEAGQHWQAVKRHGGNLIHHRLIHYIGDRQLHHARWEHALEEAEVPTSFLWGMEDPVSGRHVAEHLRRRMPGVNLHALENVGHYPQLEVPGEVAAHLLKFL